MTTDDVAGPAKLMHVDLDSHGCILEDGIYTYVGNNLDVHYLLAPGGIPGIRAGTKLDVVNQFMSDGRCPFGAGLMCVRLKISGSTRGSPTLVAVFTKRRNGIAWMLQDCD